MKRIGKIFEKYDNSLIWEFNLKSEKFIFLEQRECLTSIFYEINF